jgi:hypothetical protein
MVALKLPFPSARRWPALTAERPTINGGHSIQTRHRQFGRPLYVAQLPVFASTSSALDDPLLTLGSHRSPSES